jgi:hypothetical protein
MLMFHNMALPDALNADVERWCDRPVMRWVAAQYQRHRVPRTEVGMIGTHKEDVVPQELAKRAARG